VVEFRRQLSDSVNLSILSQILALLTRPYRRHKAALVRIRGDRSVRIAIAHIQQQRRRSRLAADAARRHQIGADNGQIEQRQRRGLVGRRISYRVDQHRIDMLPSRPKPDAVNNRLRNIA
jgi:hypothetical protein